MGGASAGYLLQRELRRHPVWATIELWEVSISDSIVMAMDGGGARAERWLPAATVTALKQVSKNAQNDHQQTTSCTVSTVCCHSCFFVASFRHLLSRAVSDLGGRGTYFFFAFSVVPPLESDAELCNRKVEQAAVKRFLSLWQHVVRSAGPDFARDSCQSTAHFAYRTTA